MECSEVFSMISCRCFTCCNLASSHSLRASRFLLARSSQNLLEEDLRGFTGSRDSFSFSLSRRKAARSFHSSKNLREGTPLLKRNRFIFVSPYHAGLWAAGHRRPSYTFMNANLALALARRRALIAQSRTRACAAKPACLAANLANLLK